MPCLWKFAVYCPNYSFSLCANVYCIYLQCTNSDLTTSDWFIYSSLTKWDSSWFSYKDKNRLSGYRSGPSFIYRSNWYFRIFQHKRISTFSFCLLVFLEIHRNLKQKEFFNSCEGFFEIFSSIYSLLSTWIFTWT